MHAAERSPKLRPEDSPIAWFSELLIAIDRDDFRQAAEAQRRLSRLGWNVNRRRTSRVDSKAEVATR